MPRMLSLMFHQIHDPLKRDRVAQFEQFLNHLVQRYRIVLPHEYQQHKTPAIFLTFDDAYFDFYYYVYPLLKRWNIKALLAVPVKAITEDSKASASERLAIRYTHQTNGNPGASATPLCTWKELKEMADSGHVIMASHGYQHADLTLKITNQREEIEYSKKLLEHKLQRSVDYFVYPYGRMDPRIHRYVRQHYTYGIRIGNAYNFGSIQKSGLIYRANADPFWIQNNALDAPWMKLKLSLKYCGNKLRKR